MSVLLVDCSIDDHHVEDATTFELDVGSLTSDDSRLTITKGHVVGRGSRLRCRWGAVIGESSSDTRNSSDIMLQVRNGRRTNGRRSNDTALLRAGVLLLTMRRRRLVVVVEMVVVVVGGRW